MRRQRRIAAEDHKGEKIKGVSDKSQQMLDTRTTCVPVPCASAAVTADNAAATALLEFMARWTERRLPTILDFRVRNPDNFKIRPIRLILLVCFMQLLSSFVVGIFHQYFSDQ